MLIIFLLGLAVLVEYKIDRLTDQVTNLKDMVRSILREVRRDLTPDDIVTRYADNFRAAVEPLRLPIKDPNKLFDLNVQLENNNLSVCVVSVCGIFLKMGRKCTITLISN